MLPHASSRRSSGSSSTASPMPVRHPPFRRPPAPIRRPAATLTARNRDRARSSPARPPSPEKPSPPRAAGRATTVPSSVRCSSSAATRPASSNATRSPSGDRVVPSTAARERTSTRPAPGSAAALSRRLRPVGGRPDECHGARPAIRQGKIEDAASILQPVPILVSKVSPDRTTSSSESARPRCACPASPARARQAGGRIANRSRGRPDPGRHTRSVASVPAVSTSVPYQATALTCPECPSCTTAVPPFRLSGIERTRSRRSASSNACACRFCAARARASGSSVGGLCAGRHHSPSCRG